MKKIIIDRVVEEVKDQGRAENTQEAYAGQLRRFQEHFKRPLMDLGEDESRAFSRHLARKFGPGSATQQQFGASVRFVYRVALLQPDKVEWPRMPRKFKKLVLWVPKPEVLRCIEAARL